MVSTAAMVSTMTSPLEQSAGDDDIPSITEMRACIERHRRELEELWIRHFSRKEHSILPENTEDVLLGPAMYSGEALTVPAPCEPSRRAHGCVPTKLQTLTGDLQSFAPAAKPAESFVSGQLIVSIPPEQALGCREDKIQLEEETMEPSEIGEEFSEEQLAIAETKKSLRATRGPSAGKLRSNFSFRDLSLAEDRWQYNDNWCTWLTTSGFFDGICALLILTNSLLVGVEVEVQDPGNAAFFQLSGYVFVAWFSLELVLRIAARGWKFFAGSDKNWNVFDCLCVLCSYFELLVDLAMAGESSFLLLLRTLRIIRIARIIRVVKFLSQLRMMVYTMLGALKMLGWACTVLGGIMYMFCVCFTEAAKTELASSRWDDRPVEAGQLHAYFGTLLFSWLTLFESITGGLSWRDALLLLQHVHAMYAALFLFYICITVFTILNIITGFCCDYAIQNAVTDRDDAIKAQIRNKEKWKKQFVTMFSTMDEDNSGEITGEELEVMLNDEEFQAYMSHLNIAVDDIMDIFEVFDKDSSGSVSVDEFVTGCLRVKGSAKTLDVMRVKNDTKFLTELVQDLIKYHQMANPSLQISNAPGA
eukprot:TRINITY_DN35303_c0_g1_i1.p1 TRINITY_DN35303_c0_g1~~TRINITY_DN35303_c0_g1_i1.p1  ORF type:complete len:589 (-),score=97.29 TRINITY_DN35303_c0_g1_i1:43-1809(-)